MHLRPSASARRLQPPPRARAAFQVAIVRSSSFALPRVRAAFQLAILLCRALETAELILSSAGIFPLSLMSCLSALFVAPSKPRS